MPNIIFSEGSGVVDSVFGKCQAPVRMFLEQRAEAFQQQSMLEFLFKMGTSENFGDLLTGMTAMEGFQPVGENGAYPDDGMEEGYQKLIVYETWKDQFKISQEAVEDGKLLDLSKKPQAFITGYYRTRELFGAALYAGAISGQKSITFRGKKFDCTGADGKCIFATNHAPKVKGDQQCNLFSDAFSVDALGRGESAMHQFKDEDGNILNVQPDTILIGTDADLRKQVFAAIGSDKDPTSNNNAFNYQVGRWNVIEWPYLNQFLAKGVKPWILLDSHFNENYGGAVWNDRIPLTVKSCIDPNTDANIWKGRARHMAAFNDWRFAMVGGMAGGLELSALNV